MAASAPKTPPDEIRAMFSHALSAMYRAEVPPYGDLLALTAEVNTEVRRGDRALDRRLRRDREAARLNDERHGAIRLGTPQELALVARLFAVMGMWPVGYYDLAAAGVPVHSTAFRPVADEALRQNPLRVFTSLLRLELIADAELRAQAAEVLARRKIVSADCLVLIETAEREGGLDEEQAERFVTTALETFRWNGAATTTQSLYEALRAAHPLLADIVCFSGPHINHLTPRTLDIDRVQARMPERGMHPKAVIEGPPPRAVPVLLRQTSFQAFAEPISFKPADDGGAAPQGVHAARFGEVEQRGVALTREGRALYDRLLSQAQQRAKASGAASYERMLAEVFAELPDDEAGLRQRGLAFFRYRPTAKVGLIPDTDIDTLVTLGFAAADPITYEDFLPVSAAGIFQSNLAAAQGADFAGSSREAFEAALGQPVADEIELYAEAQARSKRETLLALLQRGVPASDHYLSVGARRSDLIVHLTGLALALIGGGMLLGLSIGAGNWRGLTAAVIYAVGLVTMLGLSTAYNFSDVRFQPLLRRFDHAGIFIMIAASYTPFTTRHLHGAWAWGMTSAVWGVAGLGAAAKLLLPGLARGFWVAVYLLLGWLVLVAVKPLLDSVGLAPLILLAVGGGLYTIGVFFYAMKRWRYRRAVWHGFVVAAAAVHWTAVLLAIVRSPAA